MGTVQDVTTDGQIFVSRRGKAQQLDILHRDNLIAQRVQEPVKRKRRDDE